MASAFTPGNSVNPVGLLRVWSNHSDMSMADAVTGDVGHRHHPIVTSVAPVSLLSTAARHIPAASAGPKCDDSQVRGNVAKYQGRSVSGIYDQLFQPGMSLPYLDSYIPQALENWTDWDGQGHDLVLLGMYRVGHKSYLVGMDPATGNSVGTVMVDESHLGGMALFGQWLFTGDNPWPKPGSPTMEKYKISDLRAAMTQAIKTRTPVYLKSDGPRQNIDATDFMSVDGDSLYTGNHGNAGVPGLMNRYVLKPDGSLKKVEGPWVIPDRAQGLIITPDDFIFSTDNNTGRGELVVVRRTAPATIKSPIGCVWMPAMPEDLTVHDGQVLTVFESGATRFAKDHPANRVTHLHNGSLEALLTAVDPIAFNAEKALGIAPTNPTPTLPLVPALPALPLLPSTPAPGAVPTLPLLPGLSNLPVVGGLTGGVAAPNPTPSTAPSATPSAAPTTGPTAAPSPAPAEIAAAAAPAPAAAPTAAPTPAAAAPMAGAAPAPAAPAPAVPAPAPVAPAPAAPAPALPAAAPLTTPAPQLAPAPQVVPVDPALPPVLSVLPPVTSVLTPSATPQPGSSPTVELWLPTERVSDAFDLYTSRTTGPDTPVGSVGVPADSATAAPTSVPTAAPPAPALDSMALPAVVENSPNAAPTTDEIGGLSHRRASRASAILSADDPAAPTGPPEHVSDARDLYETAQADQFNAG